MNKHFTNDELIDRLYGVGDGGEHLAACKQCSVRMEEMRRVKARLNAQTAREDGAISADFLAAQRRAIYARLGESPRATSLWMKAAWAPALAAAAVVAIGLAAHHPGSAGPVASLKAPVKSAAAFRPDADDAKLFADVYSMEQSSEPSVAAPIHELFEDQQ